MRPSLDLGVPEAFLVRCDGPTSMGRVYLLMLVTAPGDEVAATEVTMS